MPPESPSLRAHLFLGLGFEDWESRLAGMPLCLGCPVPRLFFPEEEDEMVEGTSQYSESVGGSSVSNHCRRELTVESRVTVPQYTSCLESGNVQSRCRCTVSKSETGRGVIESKGKSTLHLLAELEPCCLEDFSRR